MAEIEFPISQACSRRSQVSRSSTRSPSSGYGPPVAAVRDGNFKAVFWGGRNAVWELHDMSKNQNETDDLSAKIPEKLEAMKKQWQTWINSVRPKKTGSNTDKKKKKKGKK